MNPLWGSFIPLITFYNTFHSILLQTSLGLRCSFLLASCYLLSDAKCTRSLKQGKHNHLCEIVADVWQRTFWICSPGATGSVLWVHFSIHNKDSIVFRQVQCYSMSEKYLRGLKYWLPFWCNEKCFLVEHKSLCPSVCFSKCTNVQMFWNYLILPLSNQGF